MPSLIRKQNPGPTNRQVTVDLAWIKKPDGKGSTLRRGPANTGVLA